jgi:3'-5' exoribonuclease
MVTKLRYVNQLQNGDELVGELFLLQEVIHRTTKDGRPFLLCTLSDKTGQIGMVLWDVPDEMMRWVQAGMVVQIHGRVVLYKDALQINAAGMAPAEQPDLTDFLPASARPRDEMKAELQQYINSLQQPWLDLLTYIFLDDDFLNSFANAPAARTMHHAYIGGLLEHTLSMAAVAEILAKHYPYVNRDLLLAGTLLHDMGKAIEYTTDPSFAFSDDGRLVGHIVRAVVIVEKAAEAIQMDAETLRLLVHMILAHHGTNEWGSPVVPKTLEAILLHQIDLLDSRVQGYFDFLRNENSTELWSARPSPMFNTELRRPPTFTKRK